MKSNVVNAEMRFRKPEPQSKLNGQLGLTVDQIAESLGIPADQVRRKLTERKMLERIKACGFNALPFDGANPTNGVRYTDYVLDLNAAKWFIGKYNNAVGDAYQAYLVKIESDAAQEGNTFGHLDPTNLAEWFADPERRQIMAKAWIMAEDQLKEQTKLRIVAETKIEELKNDPITNVTENALPAYKVYAEFPEIRKLVKARRLKTRKSYTDQALTSLVLKNYGIEKVLMVGKSYPYSVFSRTDVETLEKMLTEANPQ